ncbi:LPXTG cell wall anchor domain-containing protein [Streptomyces sp. NPDC002073]
MKLLSLLAAAGLATLGSALPAHAAEHAAGRPEVTLSGPAEVRVRPHPGAGEPQHEQLVVSARNPTAQTTGPYTLTVDFRGLARVARVTARSNGACTTTATTLVCERPGAAPGPSMEVELDVFALKGSRPGDTGELTVTGQGAGASYRGFTTTVGIGGTDVSVLPFEMSERTKVGDRQPVPLAFTNTGSEDAGELLLTLDTTRGLEFVERYDNCEYPDPRRAVRASTVRCHFTGPFEAGATYELDSPLTLLTNRHARSDAFGYALIPDPDEDPERAAGHSPRTAAHAAGARTGADKGAALGLSARPAGAAAPTTADLRPSDNGQDFTFETANEADFAAFGATVRGAEGATVPMRVALRNQGPAWLEDPDGEPFGVADVRIPAGAKVTRKPENCSARTAAGAARAEQLGAPRYFCTRAAKVFLDGDAVSFPFEMVVERYVPDAAGSVTIGRSFGADAGTAGPRRLDRNRANDTAKIVLNAKTAASPQPVPTTTATPSPSASATASPTPSASASASARPGGDLASTGGGNALPLAALAGAAVLAGGVLVLAFRRRTAGA